MGSHASPYPAISNDMYQCVCWHLFIPWQKAVMNLFLFEQEQLRQKGMAPENVMWCILSSRNVSDQQNIIVNSFTPIWISCKILHMTAGSKIIYVQAWQSKHIKYILISRLEKNFKGWRSHSLHTDSCTIASVSSYKKNFNIVHKLHTTNKDPNVHIPEFTYAINILL